MVVSRTISQLSFIHKVVAVIAYVDSHGWMDACMYGKKAVRLGYRPTADKSNGIKAGECEAATDQQHLSFVLPL